MRNKIEGPKDEKINQNQNIEKPKNRVDSNKAKRAKLLENTIHELEEKLVELEKEKISI